MTISLLGGAARLARLILSSLQCRDQGGTAGSCADVPHVEVEDVDVPGHPWLFILFPTEVAPVDGAPVVSGDEGHEVERGGQLDGAGQEELLRHPPLSSCDDRGVRVVGAQHPHEVLKSSFDLLPGLSKEAAPHTPGSHRDVGETQLTKQLEVNPTHGGYHLDSPLGEREQLAQESKLAPGVVMMVIMMVVVVVMVGR